MTLAGKCWLRNELFQLLSAPNMSDLYCCLLVHRVEHAYLALAQSLTEFFSAASEAEKTHCQGEVYRSERGIPMWRTGYEQCGEMRYSIGFQ
jgi:hypothetical protein